MTSRILVDRYQILRLLSSGGFSQTYLARDHQLPGQPICVVKQLKPLQTDSQTMMLARRLFDAEAQLLHQLGSHDQIPRLLAHFQEDQEFYLVEEFIEGHPLSQELVPGKQWDEAYVLSLLHSILKPLAFVHQHYVIHRDLKPANIIRRQKDSELVLIDFGAVKQLQIQQANSHSHTNTVAIGTTGYMPSEQGRGAPRLSSDIYGLGMIAVQALTGIKPEHLPEDMETGEIIWRDRAEVSPELAEILDRMIRYDFRERFRSAIDLLEVLNQPQDKRVLDRHLADSFGEKEGRSGSQSSQPISAAPTIADSAATLETLVETAAVDDTFDQGHQATLPQTVAEKPFFSRLPEARPPQRHWGHQYFRWIALGGSVLAIIVIVLAGYGDWRRWVRQQPPNPYELPEPGTCSNVVRIVDDPEPPLNIRKGPGTQHPILRQLNNGERVVIVGEQAGWVRISYPVPGWIAENRTKPFCR